MLESLDVQEFDRMKVPPRLKTKSLGPRFDESSHPVCGLPFVQRPTWSFEFFSGMFSLTLNDPNASSSRLTDINAHIRPAYLASQPRQAGSQPGQSAG